MLISVNQIIAAFFQANKKIPKLFEAGNRYYNLNGQKIHWKGSFENVWKPPKGISWKIYCKSPRRWVPLIIATLAICPFFDQTKILQFCQYIFDPNVK